MPSSNFNDNCGSFLTPQQSTNTSRHDAPRAWRKRVHTIVEQISDRKLKCESRGQFSLKQSKSSIKLTPGHPEALEILVKTSD